MRLFSSVVIYLITISVVKSNVSYSTFECDVHCVPDTCEDVENVACDFPDESFDTTDLIEQMPCKECS